MLRTHAQKSTCWKRWRKAFDAVMNLLCQEEIKRNFSNLDYENQKRVLECLEQLSDSGMGIILSSHSPNHALYCNMEVVLIDKKKKIHKGLIADTLTDELLRDVYGVNIQLINGITKDGIEVQTCYMVK